MALRFYYLLALEPVSTPLTDNRTENFVKSQVRILEHR